MLFLIIFATQAMQAYLEEYGLEVLTRNRSRFWAQRVNWSEADKGKYVMLGVTGTKRIRKQRKQ